MSTSDSKVQTISRLAQWKVDFYSHISYQCSDAFRIGLWNWKLAVKRDRHVCIRLFPEPGKKEQPPIAKFVLRVSISGANRRPFISPVINDRLFQAGDDFLWPIDATTCGRYIIDVEFLDLKISSSDGEATPAWYIDGPMQTVMNKGTLRCLSRMLHEGIHADITINTSNSMLKAHKSVLSASSPVFESMFLHDLKEKESSTINIDDMSMESCSALLGYIYGEVKHSEFLKHRLQLVAAADKYDMGDLNEACEESLLEDINSSNVLERLNDAWLYRLNKLKKGCMAFLFDFKKIHDLKDELASFFQYADRELIVEMFQEGLNFWETD